MSSLSTPESKLEAFEPRESLWKLVEEFAPEKERREIKEILGEDVIDETVDLHREVSALLEIWQDYRDENDKKTKELSLGAHFKRLPEPPQMRSNLKKEIQLFVTALKQKSGVNGSIDSLSLSMREIGIVEYALKESDSETGLPSVTRPPTARSRENGRCTPCRSTSSESGSRSLSSLGDVMESFQEQINVEDICHLAERLRNILVDEKDMLLEDIAFLQNSLFEESQSRENVKASSEPKPSLQELKELGIKLEKEMTMKGSLPTLFEIPVQSSPPRRPQRKRNVVRSSSTPVDNIMREKPSRRGIHDGAKARSPPISSSSCSGSDSFSPSPPTSAVYRRPGSASRFRKMVLESRHDES